LDVVKEKMRRTRMRMGLGGFCGGVGRRGAPETKGIVRLVGMEEWRRKKGVLEEVGRRRRRRWWKGVRRDF
jgi:hypothetical protein